MVTRNRLDPSRPPVWLKYIISLIVTAVVATAAWFVGRDNPVLGRMENVLVPVLAWSYLFLLAIAIIDLIRKRR